MPFQTVSARERPTREDAADLYDQYTTIVNEGAFDVVYFGVTFDHQFIVRDVLPLQGEVTHIGLGIGGVDNNNPSHGLIRAVWTLLPVPRT